MIDPDNRDGVLRFIARADRGAAASAPKEGPAEAMHDEPADARSKILPTTRRICWWSTTIAGFASCCRAS